MPCIARDEARALYGAAAAGSQRRSVSWLLALLVLCNAAAWLWAWSLCGRQPALLGAASLCALLGLRHAFDADHIAAIDNVTRKLVRAGQRPIAVGFFFSLGHATVIALFTVMLVRGPWTAPLLTQLRHLGTTAGPLISSALLLLFAAVNARALMRLLPGRRAERRRRGSLSDPVPLGGGAPSGILAWALRPLLSRIDRSWMMLPIGALFGLGFDTASEIGLIAVASAQAAALPGAAVLLLPVLFGAAMALFDAAQGLLMMRAYAWAHGRVEARRAYDVTVTTLSIIAAAVVAGLQLSGVVSQAGGPASRSALWLEEHSTLVGTSLTAVLLLTWVLAVTSQSRRASIQS